MRAAAPTLARAHGLMGRLIVFSNTMRAQIAAQDGLFKVGLYAPRQGVGDIAGRFRQAAENLPVWIDRVFPANPAVAAVALNSTAILDSLRFEVGYLADASAVAKPKIHLKANFRASAVAWDALYARPELGEVLREYIAYLARQAGRRDQDGPPPDVRVVPERLQRTWFRLIENLVGDLKPGQREELAFYFTVGSTNMDYRSMVMDGEVMVVLGGWQSVFGYLDFLLLPGMCEWLETTDELDALLTPPGGFTRSMAGLMKLSL